MKKGRAHDISPSSYLVRYAQRMKTFNSTLISSLDRVFQDLETGFQDLLVAVQLAKNIDVLDDEAMMPIIVGALRDHMASSPGEKLYDSYFGFLSVNLILRTIQVGVLSRLDLLYPFIDTAQYGTEVTITQTLADAVSYKLQSSMSRDGYGVHPGVSFRLLKNGVLLPEVGGLSLGDLLFLLDILWTDRKRFLMIMSRGNLFSLGWSALFCMIFKQFEANETSVTGYQWAHLRHLLYRYRLYAPSKDEELAETMCNEIETGSRFREFARLPVFYDPVDEEDARSIAKAYISRVTPTSEHKIEFPTEMSPVQIAQVPFHAMVQMKVYDLIAPCTNASILRIWVDIDALAERCKAGQVKSAVEQVFVHAWHMLKHYNIILNIDPELMPPEYRVGFLRALANGDFVSAIGRALLAYATHFASGEAVDYGGCRIWRGFIKEVKNMASTLKNRYPVTEVSKIFEGSHVDLHRACHQSRVIMGHVEPNHHLYKFARDSLQVLDQLLVAATSFNLHEFDQLIPPANCAYNRCPGVYGGPVSPMKKPMACEGCLVTEYCSRECQLADWEFGCPESHCVSCGTL